MSGLVPALLAGAVWWIIPIVLLAYPRSGDEKTAFGLFALGIAAIVATSVACAAKRQAPWSVMLWMPPALLASIASFSGTARLFQEAGTLFGGVAVLIGLPFLVVLVGATILLLYFHPKPFHKAFTACAILNSIAIGTVASKFDYQADRQNLTIHILDFQGQPVSGAKLEYERFGYGPGGSDVPAGRGEPLISDSEGIVHPHIRKMRNGFNGTIRHPEYRTVKLTVEMQFSKWDTTRHCKIGTESTPTILYGTIAIKEPLTMYVYLPPVADRPDDPQTKRQEISTHLGATPKEKASLNIETGVFSNSAADDLRLEVFYEQEGQYERARLRIRGLNGTGVQMLPANVSFSEPIPAPERIFKIAPVDGYADEVTIDRPGDSPGPRIFVSARDGKIFAMLSLSLYDDRSSKTARCRIELIKNIAGKRVLEYPRNR